MPKYRVKFREGGGRDEFIEADGVLEKDGSYVLYKDGAGGGTVATYPMDVVHSVVAEVDSN